MDNIDTLNANLEMKEAEPNSANGEKKSLSAIVKCEVDLRDNFSSNSHSYDDHIDEAMIEKIKPDSKEPYVCEGCGKTFLYSGWLDRHKLTSQECSHLPLNSVEGKDDLLNVGPSTSSDKLIKTYSKSVNETVTKNEFNSGRKTRSFNVDKRQDNSLRSNHTIETDYQNNLTQNGCEDNGGEVQTGSLQGDTSGFTENMEKEFKQGEVLIEEIENNGNLVLMQSNVICSICSKRYNDVHEHIEHMTKVHQMKASFRCSTCGQTFPTKNAVEDHLQIHAQSHQALSLKEQELASIDYSKGLDDVQQEYIIENTEYSEDNSDRFYLSQLATIDVIEEEEDLNDKDILDEVYNCICGKAYLLKPSYEQHLQVCPSLVNSKGFSIKSDRRLRETASTPASKSKTSLLPMHCRRDLVEKLHMDGDLQCKACLRPSRSVLCVHNHLSRMHSCREYYCTVLFPTLDLDTIDQKEDINYRPTKRSKSNHSLNNQTDTAVNSDSSLTKRSSLQTHSSFKSSPTLSSSVSKSTKYDPEKKMYQSRDSLQCPRCLKTFSGKSSHLAYTNHVRSSRACFPSNSEQDVEEIEASSTPSQNERKLLPFSKNSSNLSNHSIDVNKPRKVVYFCKLCPNRDIKNRVTLGTHLTQYHGLPPVNINTPEGAAMRCQTCCQTFTSKYFYNMHRYDCDKTSPYVGIILADGSELTNDPDYFDQREDMSFYLPTSSLLASKNQTELASSSSYLSDTFTCSLCNKTGFLSLNSVKMHQRYQCVKRNSQAIKPSHFSSIQRTSFQRSRRNRRNRKTDSKASNYYVKKVSLNASSGTAPVKKSYYSEIARINDLAKNDNSLTMCDACGRGPYNSYYYLLEHQNKFCRALKKGSNDLNLNYASKYNDSEPRTRNGPGRKPNVAKKSLPTAIVPQIAKKSFPNASKAEKESSHEKNETDEIGLFNDIEDIDSDQYFDCSQCDLKSNDLVRFITHRLKHLGQDLGNSLSEQTYFCELCKGKFITSQYQKMQQHLLSHLKTYKTLKHRKMMELQNKDMEKSDIEESDDDEEALLTCPYCKATFGSRTALANHIKTSCPFRYQCNKCSRTYLTKESLNNHKENCPGDTSVNSARASCVCKHCGLRFKAKSRLIHHQQVCFKVFNADISSRVEQIIEKASTCSICGFVAKNYRIKSKHELKCLKKAVTHLGYQFSLFPNNGNDDSDIEFDSVTEPSEISSSIKSEAMEPTKLVEQYSKHGIEKEIKVNLNRLEDEMNLANLRQDEDDDVKFEELRKKFLQLLNHLITDEEILKEVLNGDTIENVLIGMLTHMGEEPESNDHLDELTKFRINIQCFLKLSIQAETLEKAYHKVKSIDEVVHNLLYFPYKLK